MLKLCDFGSAKRIVKGESNVSYICSRYYRAPELIFGATDYSAAIDVWSTGCVIAELLLGQPLFPGESGVDQLVEIIKVLGLDSTRRLPKTPQNVGAVARHVFDWIFHWAPGPGGVLLMVFWDYRRRPSPNPLQPEARKL